MGFLLPRSLPFAHPQPASPADGRHCGLFIHRMRGSWLQILCLKQPRMGFEPTTYRLRSDCSTVELPRRHTQKDLQKSLSVSAGVQPKAATHNLPPQAWGGCSTVELPRRHTQKDLQKSLSVSAGVQPKAATHNLPPQAWGGCSTVELPRRSNESLYISKLKRIFKITFRPAANSAQRFLLTFSSCLFIKSRAASIYSSAFSIWWE